MIALDVTSRQAALCAERRLRNGDQFAMLAKATAENTAAIAKLADAVVTLTTTVAQVVKEDASQSTAIEKHSEKLGDHETRLSVMYVKMGLVAAAVGSVSSTILQRVRGLINH